MHQDNSARLSFRGHAIDLPIIDGTEGEVGIDVSALRAKTGAITVDLALGNTGAAVSALTYLDGEQGVLRHGGYEIQDLASHCCFEEVCYLLFHGDLPTESQLQAFRAELSREMYVPPAVKVLIHSFPRSAHPMGILQAAVASMSCHFEEVLNATDEDERVRLRTLLLAKMPLLVGYVYRHRTDGYFATWPKQASFEECFMEVMFGKQGEPYRADETAVAALRTMLIAHADHEQNCSTTATRVVGSSQANGFAVVSAAIGALWGALHGGANQQVVEMLNHIVDSGRDVHQVIEAVKAKEFLLMGFGHRVYKNFDPRAQIAKQRCDELLAALQIDDPKLPVAKALETAAREDEYFIARSLYPNVDFYSGIVYGALGIPLEMFTPMFVLGRLPGWLAHWEEELSQEKARINRPRQIYVGPTARPFVPMDAR